MLKTAEFWVLVSFLAFMGLLLKMKVPAMLANILDDRAVGIRKELDEARRLRQEAQDLLAEYQRKQRLAEDEAKAIIEQAQREAQAMKTESASRSSARRGPGVSSSSRWQALDPSRVERSNECASGPWSS